MATLSILNSFSLPTQGNTFTGKQGASAGAFGDEFDVTVTGTIHLVQGQLATASIVTVYDDDNDVPADWDYLYYWCDQVSYLQIIGANGNAVFKIAATQPFVLPGYDGILAVANTTAITGGTEPTLEDIDSIVIGNYSGNQCNYLFAVID